MVVLDVAADGVEPAEAFVERLLVLGGSIPGFAGAAAVSRGCGRDPLLRWVPPPLELTWLMPLPGMPTERVRRPELLTEYRAPRTPPLSPTLV